MNYTTIFLHLYRILFSYVFEKKNHKISVQYSITEKYMEQMQYSSYHAICSLFYFETYR